MTAAKAGKSLSQLLGEIETQFQQSVTHFRVQLSIHTIGNAVVAAHGVSRIGGHNNYTMHSRFWLTLKRYSKRLPISRGYKLAISRPLLSNAD